MLAWMGYSTLVGALLCAAAVLLEHLSLFGAHKRLLWLGGIVATELLTVLALLGDARPGTTIRTVGSAFDGALALVWILGLLLCTCVLLFSAIRLAYMQRKWREDVVAGVPVRVSHDVGPAVVGLLHHGIVVPGWVCSLRDEDKRLVMSHEREHVRAGDPLLLWGATLLVAFLPWNAALWFALHRLRHAIEMDCDARVLRARSDAHAYCSLLVDVGERTLAGAAPVVALAEPATLLERRITAMTQSRSTSARGVAAILVGAVLLTVAACRMPQPDTAPRARLVALVREMNELLARDTVTRTFTSTERAAAQQTVQRAVEQLRDSAPVTRTISDIKPPMATVKTLADGIVDHSRTADEVFALLAPTPVSAVARYYPELLERKDTTSVVVVLTYDPNGRLIGHAMRPFPISRTVGAEDFADRDIALFRWKVHAADHYAIATVVELGWHEANSSYGNFRRPTASNNVPAKHQFGYRTDSLAREEYDYAYRTPEGIAYVVGALFDSDGNIVAKRILALPEHEVFDSPNARARSDAWALATLFGKRLPAFRASGSQTMRDAPRLLLVFGELLPGEKVSVRPPLPSRDSLLKLANLYERTAATVVSTGTTYIAFRFDSAGHLLEHHNMGLAPGREESLAELHQEFFLDSSLSGKDEASLMVLRDGNPRVMPGPLVAVVVRPKE